MKHATGTILLTLAIAALSGCAETTSTTTGSIPVAKLAPNAKPMTEEERRRADVQSWCGQRHVDYQNGVKTGSSQTLESKQIGDEICAKAWRKSER